MIGPWLLWNVNKKSYALYRMVTFSMALTGPNLVFKVTPFLKLNISKMVRVRDSYYRTLIRNHITLSNGTTFNDLD